MIKLVSLVVFIGAFIWSWFMLNSKSTLGIDVHAGIQSKLAVLIEETLKNKRPDSTNFKLLKMYTQRIDDNKVSAHFSYKYDDALPANDEGPADITEQKISGTAILTKGLSEDPEIQKWIVQSVKTGTENLDFKEGLVITSDGNIDETQTAPASPAEPKKTE